MLVNLQPPRTKDEGRGDPGVGVSVVVQVKGSLLNAQQEQMGILHSILGRVKGSLMLKATLAPTFQPMRGTSVSFFFISCAFLRVGCL